MTLLEFQRQMAADVMRPLETGDRIADATEHGEQMRGRAATYVKPNDRLSSVERLEIYNRQYWYRILDCLYDDFPGLRAVLGERAFRRLSLAYLTERPSESFTLRNLGSRLEAWLRIHPEHAGERLPLALDMTRLEWAHIEAFDGAESPVLGPEDLIEVGPELRVAVQPYVQLLQLQYPVDDLRVDVSKNSEDHARASNAVGARKRTVARRVARLKSQKIYVAVHRVNFDVYYRRLAAEELQLLLALRSGTQLEDAIAGVVENSALDTQELTRTIGTWFAAWAQLGWLCRPTLEGETAC